MCRIFLFVYFLLHLLLLLLLLLLFVVNAVEVPLQSKYFCDSFFRFVVLLFMLFYVLPPHSTLSLSSV